MKETIPTVYHAYSFDLAKPDDATAYAALSERLKATGIRQMHSLGTHYFPSMDGITVDLETKHLFNNQWNTAPIPSATAKDAAEKGLRVFDWAEEAIFNAYGHENKNLRRGHWLEQTPAMTTIRQAIHTCGYCGKQEPADKGLAFCPHCIDSPYLEAKQLHLTRMVCIADTDKPRAKLTDAERAERLPLYKAAQLHGSTERGKARIAKERAEIESDFRKSTESATTKRDGLTWLMDKGIRIDNCIYYSHTGRFCFGWRQPVSEELKSDLLDIVSEFPFPYDIKCADGKTLSGY